MGCACWKRKVGRDGGYDGWKDEAKRQIVYHNRGAAPPFEVVEPMIIKEWDEVACMNCSLADLGGRDSIEWIEKIRTSRSRACGGRWLHIPPLGLLSFSYHLPIHDWWNLCHLEASHPGSSKHVDL